MILFPLITITDSTPFTLRLLNDKWGIRPVLTHLTAWADVAGGDIFCGHVPEAAIEIENLSTTIGAKLVRSSVALSSSRMEPAGIPGVMPGSVWSSVDDAGDDGNYVVANYGSYIEMRDNFTVAFSGATGVFTPPDVTSANGLPLTSGNERQWTTSNDSRFLIKPIKFVVATGITSYLRLAYEIA